MTTPLKPRIIGRSSSHFTRVVRIFALEFGVEHSFDAVADLMSLDIEQYAGNPALRVPILETANGSWFGALNICHELSRQSQARARLLASSQLRVVWPEDLHLPVLANAQELTTQAMALEVSLITAKLAQEDPNNAQLIKMRVALQNILSWLESNLDNALSKLPADCDLSFLEVTMYCLVTHLEFREVLPMAAYGALNTFCGRFGERASARATVYRFDN